MLVVRNDFINCVITFNKSKPLGDCLIDKLYKYMFMFVYSNKVLEDSHAKCKMSPCEHDSVTQTFSFKPFPPSLSSNSTQEGLVPCPTMKQKPLLVGVSKLGILQNIDHANRKTEISLSTGIVSSEQ